MKKFFVLIIAALLVLTAASVSAKGITVAVPNDATNEGRALLLLEAYGVIDVDDEAGITATIADIKDNPLGIEFVEVEAAMVPNVLADVDYGIINGNYALAAELDAALLYENAESPYVNVVSVKEANKDSDEAKALAAAVLSQKRSLSLKNRPMVSTRMWIMQLWPARPSRSSAHSILTPMCWKLLKRSWLKRTSSLISPSLMTM